MGSVWVHEENVPTSHLGIDNNCVKLRNLMMCSTSCRSYSSIGIATKNELVWFTPEWREVFGPLGFRRSVLESKKAIHHLYSIHSCRSHVILPSRPTQKACVTCLGSKCIGRYGYGYGEWYWPSSWPTRDMSSRGRIESQLSSECTEVQ